MNTRIVELELDFLNSELQSFSDDLSELKLDVSIKDFFKQRKKDIISNKDLQRVTRDFVSLLSNQYPYVKMFFSDLEKTSSSPELEFLSYIEERLPKSYILFYNYYFRSKKIIELIGTDWLDNGLSISKEELEQLVSQAFYLDYKIATSKRRKESEKRVELERKKRKEERKSEERDFSTTDTKKTPTIVLQSAIEIKQDKKLEQEEVSARVENVSKYFKHRQKLENNRPKNAPTPKEIKVSLKDKFTFLSSSWTVESFLDEWFESSSNNIKVTAYSNDDTVQALNLNLGYAKKRVAVNGLFRLIPFLNKEIGTYNRPNEYLELGEGPVLIQKNVGHDIGFVLYKDKENALNLALGAIPKDIFENDMFTASILELEYNMPKYSEYKANQGLTDDNWFIDTSYSAFYASSDGRKTYCKRYENFKVRKYLVDNYYNTCHRPNDEWLERNRTEEGSWWGEYDIIGPEVTSNKVLFIAYFPHSKTIKIGRTQDYTPLKKFYLNNKAKKPEISGLMRILSIIPTKTSNIDKNIDELLNWCSEDDIKAFMDGYKGISQNRKLGVEFFSVSSSVNLRKLCKDYISHYESLTLQELLNFRNEYKIKQFVERKSFENDIFKSQLLLERIQKLKEGE